MTIVSLFPAYLNKSECHYREDGHIPGTARTADGDRDQNQAEPKPTVPIPGFRTRAKPILQTHGQNDKDGSLQTKASRKTGQERRFVVDIYPRLHEVKKLSGLRFGLQSGRCTCLHGTFFVQFNKAHHIVVHCYNSIHLISGQKLSRSSVDIGTKILIQIEI